MAILSPASETTRKEPAGATLASVDFWSFCQSLASAPKSTRAATAPDAFDAAKAWKAPTAASAFFFASAFWAALRGPAMSFCTSSRAAIFSCCGMVAASTSSFSALTVSPTAAMCSGVARGMAPSMASRSRISVAAAWAAAAFSRVAATTRRTPLAMPFSSSSAKPTASFVLRTCVPPQSSTDMPRQAAPLGAATTSATGAPTATTRTGSGYASPFIARRLSTAMAASKGVSTASTTKPAAMVSLTMASTALSWSAVSGASHAKSKRSRSSST
mmetsp:Transcript_16253/g.53020  ORF Transcript_16253/g.53020 Transcript_16253/m.53020 type:complete len:273 (-) Transcript_16253:2067-2885(-)